MRYETFGRTGLPVSEVSLGTWGIGGIGWGGEVDEAGNVAAINAALDCGINLIDTAPAYNAGVAERTIAKAMAGRRREDIYLLTKAGTKFINGGYVRCGGFDDVVQQCEQSLRDLGTDYIDIYMIHWPDPNVPVEETMGALAKLKKDGKIRFTAASNFTPEEIAQVETVAPLDVLQLKYSMVDRKFEKRLQMAHEAGIGLMTYGSMGGGILGGKFREVPTFAEDDNRNRFYDYFKEPKFSKVMEMLQVMDKISEVHGGAPLSQIAINWVVQKPYVQNAIIGVRKASHATENCGFADWKLTEEEMQALDEISQWSLEDTQEEKGLAR